jgi:hypothetical protein
VSSCPSVVKFIEAKAKKLNLDLNAWICNKSGTELIQNRDFVYDMLLVGINANFFGEEGDEAFAEKEYCLDVDKPEIGIRYIIRGFIDKMFVRRDSNSKVKKVEIVDYKSSKQKFSGDKIKFNIQGVIYQMFALDMYPEVEEVYMNFLFLQYGRNPWQAVDAVSSETIRGVEVYLTELFHKINNYTENDAKSNFAKYNGGHNLCGKLGFKTIYDKQSRIKVETQEPKWICPYKRPFRYFAAINQDGEVKRTSRTRSELVLKTGETCRVMAYGGCPAYYGEREEHENFLNAL